MTNVLRTAGFVFALSLVLGCASRSIREPPAPLVEFKTEAKIASLWTADVGSASARHLTLTPALSGDAVYVADASGKVSAYAMDSGRRLWRTELNAPVSGATGVGDGLVVVATRKGAVIALDQANGRELWRTAVSSEVLAPPAVNRGIVAVQTIDGKLIGLSAADGKRAWLYDRTEPALSVRGTSTPVVSADMVLTGFASGRLTALQLRDGRLLWELPVTQPRGRNEIERLVDVDAPPLVQGDTLYAASYHGKLIAVNMRNGSIAWSRDVSTHTGLAADGAYVFLTDENGQVLAFDQRTGASVWRQEKLRGRELNAPVVTGDYVVVGDFEGYVHWLARDDGRLLARYRVASGAIRAPGVLGPAALYVVAGDTLAALNAMP